MSRFVAHLIMRVVYDQERPGESIPLWENIHLVQASSAEDARAKADSIGRASEITEQFWCEGHEATLRYVGTRKLLSFDGFLRNGAELSHLQLEVATEADLELLMKNKPVTVVCYDDISYHDGLTE